jgi:hypothetical protein
MKMLLASIIVALAALTVPVRAASFNLTKPEDAGMSSKRLERIGTALRAEIDEGLMPGAVVAVSRKGKLVYYESSAISTRPRARPCPRMRSSPLRP